jgi:hypothetical protein
MPIIIWTVQVPAVHNRGATIWKRSGDAALTLIHVHRESRTIAALANIEAKS